MESVHAPQVGQVWSTGISVSLTGFVEGVTMDMDQGSFLPGCCLSERPGVANLGTFGAPCQDLWCTLGIKFRASIPIDDSTTSGDPRLGRNPEGSTREILCTIPDLIEIAAILDKPIEYFLSDANIISSFRAPQTPEEWRAMYPGEPDRATAHESIDRIYRDAQRVLTAQIRAGIGSQP